MSLKSKKAALVAMGIAVALLGNSPVYGLTVNIVSDTSWVASNTEQNGWETVGFDDSAWTHAFKIDWYPYPADSYIPGTLGKHVWAFSSSTAYLRKEFVLTGTPENSQAIIRVDDCYDFYVNGVLAGAKHTVQPAGAQSYDISSLLVEGDNVFAVEAWNIAGWACAMLFDSQIVCQVPDGGMSALLLALPIAFMALVKTERRPN